MATLKIPAAYLEDVRSAVIREIVGDSKTLRINHESVLAGTLDGDTEDRTSAAAQLERSTGLLNQILDATTDATLDGRDEDLTYVLEELVRVLVERLQSAKGYSPIPMSEVLDITERVRWAAEEAVRIDPRVATWLSAKDREVA